MDRAPRSPHRGRGVVRQRRGAETLKPYRARLRRSGGPGHAVRGPIRDASRRTHRARGSRPRAGRRRGTPPLAPAPDRLPLPAGGFRALGCASPTSLSTWSRNCRVRCWVVAHRERHVLAETRRPLTREDCVEGGPVQLCLASGPAQGAHGRLGTIDAHCDSIGCPCRGRSWPFPALPPLILGAYDHDGAVGME